MDMAADEAMAAEEGTVAGPQVATTAMRVAATAVVHHQQRVDARVTGRALSAESTTSLRGTSASAARRLVPMAGTARLVEVEVEVEGTEDTAAAAAEDTAAAAAAAAVAVAALQGVQATGSARPVKSTTSHRVTFASAARSPSPLGCLYVTTYYHALKRASVCRGACIGMCLPKI
jgi:hypothetical protein